MKPTFGQSPGDTLIRSPAVGLAAPSTFSLYPRGLKTQKPRNLTGDFSLIFKHGYLQPKSGTSLWNVSGVDMNQPQP